MKLRLDRDEKWPDYSPCIEGWGYEIEMSQQDYDCWMAAREAYDGWQEKFAAMWVKAREEGINACGIS